MKIQVNTRNRAYQYDSAEDEHILYAGLSAAVDLPYECGSGTCGTCKARLIEGKVTDTWPEAPGHSYLKNDDEFLMCQCKAATDVVIEVDNFVQEMPAGACIPTALNGRISSSKLLTPDVMFVQVELEQPLVFDAGQFVLIEAPDVPGFRGWSMVNFDRQAKTLDFVVKKKPGGALTEWLFSTPSVGVDVKLFGPLGKATFFPAVAKNILCIAGGSGIAGMMSILSRAAQENYFAQYKGDLFFGIRTMQDAFFLPELARLRADCGENLNITIALSEEEAPASARTDHPELSFDSGFVHEVANRQMTGRYDGVRAYLAGPPPAVEAAIRTLLMARVSTDNIRYDKFS